MEFTWRHIILLAEKMFHYSDDDVAHCLDINRSTVYRHKQEENNRDFRVKVDIYKELFMRSDTDSKILLANLKETLNEDDFPTSVRDLKFTEYEPYIRHLLKLADKAEKVRKSTQLSKQDSSDSGEQSTSDLAIDGAVKKVRSVWEPEPVSMPEEFYKCFNKYAIADFVKLDPMNLILINYMIEGKRPDGEAMIKGAIQFVKDTENAMQRAEISFWNEKVCKAISAFTKSLREYIDFLMENAESPDFTTCPFLLNPIDTDEFKRKGIWHRKKLQSIYRQIIDVKNRWHGLEVYVNFPGQ